MSASVFTQLDVGARAYHCAQVPARFGASQRGCGPRQTQQKGRGADCPCFPHEFGAEHEDRNSCGRLSTILLRLGCGLGSSRLATPGWRRQYLRDWPKSAPNLCAMISALRSARRAQSPGGEKAYHPRTGIGNGAFQSGRVTPHLRTPRSSQAVEDDEKVRTWSKLRME